MDSQQDEEIKTHGGCGPRFCSWSQGRRHLLRLSALYSLSGQRALQLGMSFTGRDAPGLIPGLWAIAVGPASGRHSFSLTLSRCMEIPRRPQARGLLCPRPPLPACTVGKPHVLAAGRATHAKWHRNRTPGTRCHPGLQPSPPVRWSRVSPFGTRTWRPAGDKVARAGSRSVDSGRVTRGRSRRCHPRPRPSGPGSLTLAVGGRAARARCSFRAHPDFGEPSEALPPRRPCHWPASC